MKTQTLKKSKPSELSESTKSPSLSKQKLNEKPLVEDIRLLGRILGDVIREQEGAAAYELIEQIRKLSVAFRRDEDHTADKALKKLLKSLTGDQTVSVIRAFTYFSHLANLAEDRHHIRRREVHERVAIRKKEVLKLLWRGCVGQASHPKPSRKLWQKAMFPPF